MKKKQKKTQAEERIEDLEIKEPESLEEAGVDLFESVEEELAMEQEAFPAEADEFPSATEEFPAFVEEFSSTVDESPSADEELFSTEEYIPTLSEELTPPAEEFSNEQEASPSTDEEFPSVAEEFPQGEEFPQETDIEAPPEPESPHAWDQEAESQPEVTFRQESPRKAWNKYFWGLDVGAHNIKLVGIQKRLKKLILTHVCVVEISPQRELPAEGKDIALVANSIIKSFEGLDLERNSVTSAIDCASAVVRQIQYPISARQKLLSALHWEVRRFIPFKPDEVVVDAQILDESGKDGKLDVLLTAVPKEQLSGHLKLLDQAGIKPLTVDAGQLAVLNAFLAHDGLRPEETVVLLDMGARASYLTIYGNVGPFFTLALSVGGSRFTREIQTRCQLAYAEAESLKCRVGEDVRDQSSDSDTYYPLHEALQNTYELIVSEIRQSLVYYNKQTGINKFDRLILTGGGSGLTEFPEYLSRKLGVQVEILNPLKKFEIDSNTFDANQLREVSPKLSLAVGLAMRGTF